MTDDQNGSSSDPQLDERSILSGMAGSIVALIMTTIVSIKQTTARCGSKLDPVLEQLINSFSRDANNFITDLNQLCNPSACRKGATSEKSCIACCSLLSAASQSVSLQTEKGCRCNDLPALKKAGKSCTCAGVRKGGSCECDNRAVQLPTKCATAPKIEVKKKDNLDSDVFSNAGRTVQLPTKYTTAPKIEVKKNDGLDSDIFSNAGRAVQLPTKYTTAPKIEVNKKDDLDSDVSSNASSVSDVGRSVPVCIIEDEFTEISSYTVDPITNKVKICTVEEHSQLAKCTLLKHQAIQVCECEDNEINEIIEQNKTKSTKEAPLIMEEVESSDFDDFDDNDEILTGEIEDISDATLETDLTVSETTDSLMTEQASPNRMDQPLETITETDRSAITDTEKSESFNISTESKPKLPKSRSMPETGTIKKREAPSSHSVSKSPIPEEKVDDDDKMIKVTSADISGDSITRDSSKPFSNKSDNKKVQLVVSNTTDEEEKKLVTGQGQTSEKPSDREEKLKQPVLEEKQSAAAIKLTEKASSKLLSQNDALSCAKCPPCSLLSKSTEKNQAVDNIPAVNAKQSAQKLERPVSPHQPEEKISKQSLKAIEKVSSISCRNTKSGVLSQDNKKCPSSCAIPAKPLEGPICGIGKVLLTSKSSNETKLPSGVQPIEAKPSSVVQPIETKPSAERRLQKTEPSKIPEPIRPSSRGGCCNAESFASICRKGLDAEKGLTKVLHSPTESKRRGLNECQNKFSVADSLEAALNCTSPCATLDKSQVRQVHSGGLGRVVSSVGSGLIAKNQPMDSRGKFTANDMINRGFIRPTSPNLAQRTVMPAQMEEFKRKGILAPSGKENMSDFQKFKKGCSFSANTKESGARSMGGNSCICAPKRTPSCCCNTKRNVGGRGQDSADNKTIRGLDKLADGFPPGTTSKEKLDSILSYIQRTSPGLSEKLMKDLVQPTQNNMREGKDKRMNRDTTPSGASKSSDAMRFAKCGNREPAGRRQLEEESYSNPKLKKAKQDIHVKSCACPPRRGMKDNSKSKGFDGCNCGPRRNEPAAKESKVKEPQMKEWSKRLSSAGQALASMREKITDFNRALGQHERRSDSQNQHPLAKR